jgi:hypothetical protein
MKIGDGNGRCNNKDNGKGAAVAGRGYGSRSGFLHCAAHGKTVSSFGGNDKALFVGRRTGKCNGLGW